MEHIWGGFLNFVPYGLWVSQVKGKKFLWFRCTWHWSMIVISILLTLVSVIASFWNIVSAASGYRVFHGNNWFCTPIHGWVDWVRFLIKVANGDKNGCNKGLRTCPHKLSWAPTSVYHFEHRLLIISNVRGIIRIRNRPLAVIKVILEIDKLQFSNDKFNFVV